MNAGRDGLCRIEPLDDGRGQGGQVGLLQYGARDGFGVDVGDEPYHRLPEPGGGAGDLVAVARVAR